MITPGLSTFGINMPKVTLKYDHMVALLETLYEKSAQKGRNERFRYTMFEYVLQTTANLFSANPNTDTNVFNIYTLLNGLEFLVPISLKPRDGFYEEYGLPLSEAEASQVKKEVIEKIGYDNIVSFKRGFGKRKLGKR